MDEHLRRRNRHTAAATGARLGVFQAHALAGPPLALIAIAADLYLIALILGLGAAVGWAGWSRDFGLRWRATPDPTEAGTSTNL